MASGAVLKAREWTGRLPPAVATDAPVLALLVLAWVTVPVFWAHLTTGLLLIAAIGIHLQTRPHRPLRSGSTRRRLAYAALIAAAAATTATGLLRWAGIPPAYLWHGGISYLMLALAALHLWWVRRVVRARMRTPRRSVR